MGINDQDRRRSTARLAKMAMLVAIAVVLVTFIHFPIIPAVVFMEYDPADIPIFIGTFAFGPLAGFVLTVITAVIQGATVSASSGIYGVIMHIIATGTFVLVAGKIYKGHKSKKSAVVALLAGVLSMTAVMIPANLLITPLFSGMPVKAVAALIPFIIAFNLIKASINGLVTFFLYKRLSRFLHK